MNLRLFLLLLGPAVLAFWAAFVRRWQLGVLLLMFAVFVFATFFPGYMEWLCLSQQATPEQATGVREAAERWGWLIGLIVVLSAFGAAKLGRYFSRSHLRKLGLPV